MLGRPRRCQAATNPTNARRKGWYCRRRTPQKRALLAPHKHTHFYATHERLKERHTAGSTPVPEERVIDRRPCWVIHKQTQPQPDASRHQQAARAPDGTEGLLRGRARQRVHAGGGNTHTQIRTMAVQSVTACMQAHIRVLNAVVQRNTVPIPYHPPRCRQLLDLPRQTSQGHMRNWVSRCSVGSAGRHPGLFCRRGVLWSQQLSQQSCLLSAPVRQPWQQLEALRTIKCPQLLHRHP